MKVHKKISNKTKKINKRTSKKMIKKKEIKERKKTTRLGKIKFGERKNIRIILDLEKISENMKKK